jgi:colicin import membrane protein
MPQALLALVRSASTFKIVGGSGSKLQVEENENVIKRREAQEKRRVSALAQEEEKAKKEAAAKERARKKAEKEKEKAQKEADRKAEKERREKANAEVANNWKRKTVETDGTAKQDEPAVVKPKRQRKVLIPTSIITRNQKRKAETASKEATATKVSARATATAKNAVKTTGPPKGTVHSALKRTFANFVA